MRQHGQINVRDYNRICSHQEKNCMYITPKTDRSLPCQGGKELIMKKRVLGILTGAVFIIVVVASLIYAYLKTPQYVGSFSSDDYFEEINIGAKPTYNVGKINDYKQACKVGIEVINEVFPVTIEKTMWYNFELEYEVYRDNDSQQWLVYIIPRNIMWVVGGAYGVILTDDGDIVSCWGER